MKQILALLCLLLAVLSSQGNKPVYTHVTCLYDIKRGSIGTYKRSFETYLSFFDELLQADSNFIIFGGKDLKEFVWKRRKPHNTVFVLKELESFKDMWFYPYVQRLRESIPQTPGFTLTGYPPFSLEYYNIIMFSKLYLLKEALEYDKFNSDFFIWTDGGLTHVFPDNRNMTSPVNHLVQWFEFIQPQWLFLTTLYGSRHQGFANSSVRYVGVDVEEVVLGGLFGGYIEAVRDVQGVFENFLRITLEHGDMNSDETLYSMLPVRYPFLFPVSIASWFDYLYNRLKIYMNSNRKQEHSRFFSASFDSEGNLLAIDKQYVTKYVVE